MNSPDKSYLFHLFKPVFTLGKLTGIVSFSIQRKPDARKCSNKIVWLCFLFLYLLFGFLCFYNITQKNHTNLLSITYVVNITTISFSTLIIIIVFYKNQNNIFDIFKRLENVDNLLMSLDEKTYTLLKKYINLYIRVNFADLIIVSIFNIQSNDIHFVISLDLSVSVMISSQLLVITFLLIVRGLLKKNNDIMLHRSYTMDNSHVLFFKMSFHVYDEIFQISKSISNIGHAALFWFMMYCSCLITAVFDLAMIIASRTITNEDIVNFIVWAFPGFVCVSFVVSACVFTKNEVCSQFVI